MNVDNNSEIKDEKKYQLYLRQKQMLELFLKNGTITQAQFSKSFNDMKEKMGFKNLNE